MPGYTRHINTQAYYRVECTNNTGVTVAGYPLYLSYNSVQLLRGRSTRLSNLTIQTRQAITIQPMYAAGEIPYFQFGACSLFFMRSSRSNFQLLFGSGAVGTTVNIQILGPGALFNVNTPARLDVPSGANENAPAGSGIALQPNDNIPPDARTVSTQSRQLQFDTPSGVSPSSIALFRPTTVAQKSTLQEAMFQIGNGTTLSDPNTGGIEMIFPGDDKDNLLFLCEPSFVVAQGQIGAPISTTIYELIVGISFDLTVDR